MAEKDIDKQLNDKNHSEKGSQLQSNDMEKAKGNEEEEKRDK
ncbi:hypothetical protein [Virgibacillus ainsalahensis]